MIVSDRLKESLSPSTLNYVLSSEGDSTFPSNKVAANAEIYVNNYTEDGKYRTSSRTEQARPFVGKLRDYVPIVSSTVSRTCANGTQSGHTMGKPKPRLCFRCKSDQHLLANCPLRASCANDRPSQVNACVAVNSSHSW